MRKLYFRILIAACLLFGFASGPTRADDEYNYGPACQWIRLQGEVPDVGSPIYLTLYYHIEGHERSGNLFMKRPLNGKSFNFVLAGFGDDIPGASFVPPFIFFAKEVTFKYLASSLDGSYSTGWREVKYSPERIKRGKEVLCQTDLELKL